MTEASGGGDVHVHAVSRRE